MRPHIRSLQQNWHIQNVQKDFKLTICAHTNEINNLCMYYYHAHEVSKFECDINITYFWFEAQIIQPLYLHQKPRSGCNLLQSSLICLPMHMQQNELETNPWIRYLLPYSFVNNDVKMNKFTHPKSNRKKRK
jgi:hypothetical protein